MGYPTLIIIVGGISVVRGSVIIYVSDLIQKCVEYLAYSVIIILLCKIRLEVVVEQISDRAARQRFFESFALSTPVIIVSDRDEKQYTVVLFTVADLPFVENIVGVQLKLSVGYEILGNYNDLSTGCLAELYILLDYVFLGVSIDYF